MPLPNYHSCRLKPPTYDKYAYEKCKVKHDGKCIDFVYGIKQGKSELQSMRFPVDVWSESDARAYCKDKDGTFEPGGKRELRKQSIHSSSVSHARSLINSGAIQTGGSWSFTSDDRHKLLNSVNGDWAKYGLWFLIHDDAYDEDTFSRYKYPYGKGGKVWRKAVIAIKQRASQQGLTELANVADSLLQAIDKKIENKGLYEYERRCVVIDEFRYDEDENIIYGYAARFNVWSEEIGGMFREKIRPGAFAKTIKESDIRALFNHDPNFILGRTGNGTLILKEDDKGLYFENKLPDTSYARDLAVSIKRGDVIHNSFGFRTIKDDWSDDGRKRELIEVRLFDISPVVFPAYPQTDVKIRSIMSEVGLESEKLARALNKHINGLDLSDEDREIIQFAIDRLSDLVSEPRDTHSDDEEKPIKITSLRIQDLLLKAKEIEI